MDGINNQGYNLTKGEVAVLTYTDNLCFIAEPPDQLQEILDRVQEFAAWANCSSRPL